MGHQSNYLLIGVCLLCVSIGSAVAYYPTHTVNATCFWVNEPADSSNAGISNVPSVFDAQWGIHFFNRSIPMSKGNYVCGGRAPKCCIELDPVVLTNDTSLVARYKKCTPAPGYNPYYFALPYYDFGSSDWDVCCDAGTACKWGVKGPHRDQRRFNRPPARGDRVDKRKPADLLRSYLYWYNTTSPADLANPNFSLVQYHWISVTNEANGQTCYGQWADAGPFGEADAPYVFGNKRPICTINDNAGLDLSPTLVQCIELDVTSGNPPADTEGLVTWQFVDEEDVPAGPWTENISGPTWRR